ncbi:hypothetical protein HI914_04673 [Erysiphe necator]|uniref:Putative pantetheine-phosphate adenylyltransferase family protein n=1 Tax=Uncinula necator TaxID=52586 RepID=A0A0B1P0U5_UNCNE|nr:hypothetical protein HI914_04673 [Erysiphe necator]KHJ30905.1 putative pantetheine-phosphate adenylyltransferase family protein [Erysiphe necator]
MAGSKTLFLLPSPPLEVTLQSVTEAYYKSLSLNLSALKDISVSTQLLVAVDWPALRGQLQAPRTKLFHEAQKLIGRLYLLINSICDELGLVIDSDLPVLVNPRIVLIDCSDLDSKSSAAWNSVTIAGPFLHLQSLSQTSNQWQQVLSTSDNAGQDLLVKYQMYSQQDLRFQHYDLETSSSSFCKPVDQKLPLNTMHNVVAVGGTFDYLHVGHKLLLTATALLLQPPSCTLSNSRLIIGITGDELLVNKKYSEYIKSWKQRQADVMEFLLSILLCTSETANDSVEISSFNDPKSNILSIHTKIEAYRTTIECVEIKDPFGPTITDKDITALIVSGETRTGGKAINQKRAENGIAPLEIYEIDVLDAQDVSCDSTKNFATKISSSQIRKLRAENALFK